MPTFRRNMLPPSSGLKMETVRFSETLPSTDESTKRQNLEHQHHTPLICILCLFRLLCNVIEMIYDFKAREWPGAIDASVLPRLWALCMLLCLCRAFGTMACKDSWVVKHIKTSVSNLKILQEMWLLLCDVTNKFPPFEARSSAKSRVLNPRPESPPPPVFSAARIHFLQKLCHSVW
jgi:hypothetical protein